MYGSKHHVYRKIALLKSLNFTSSNEPKSHSFQATGLILVSKEAEFCAQQSYGDFFQFSNSKKYFSFLGKYASFRIKFDNSKTKMKFVKKILYIALQSEGFRFDWYKNQLCRFNCAVRYPILFPVLRLCSNFHHNQTNNKKKIGG